MSKTRLLAIVSFALFTFPALGFECHSIDVTFRPYWTVKFGPITMTHPAGFSFDFTKTEDLAGKVVRRFPGAGIGTMSDTSFDVELTRPHGYLRGSLIGDELWKAELSLDGERPEELLCQ